MLSLSVLCLLRDSCSFSNWHANAEIASNEQQQGENLGNFIGDDNFPTLGFEGQKRKLIVQSSQFCTTQLCHGVKRSGINIDAEGDAVAGSGYTNVFANPTFEDRKKR